MVIDQLRPLAAVDHTRSVMRLQLRSLATVPQPFHQHLAGRHEV